MLEADASWAHEDAQLDGTLHFSNSYMLCTRNEHFPHEPSYCRVSSIVIFFNCSQRHPGWSAAQTPPAGRPLALPPDSLSLGFRQFTKHHPFTQPPCCWRLCHLLSSQQPLGQAVSSSCGWNTGSEVAEWHRLCSPPALNSSSAWDALVWPWTSNLTSLSLSFLIC